MSLQKFALTNGGFCLLVITCLLSFSCNNNKAGLWEDYNYVFNQDGEVKDYTIGKGKPYVINFATLSDLTDILYHTPRGKIDTMSFPDLG